MEALREAVANDAAVRGERTFAPFRCSWGCGTEVKNECEICDKCWDLYQEARHKYDDEIERDSPKETGAS